MSIKKTLLFALCTGILLTACGAQQATEVPTLDVNAIQTDAVNTFAASVNQSQTAEALLATATSTASPTPASSPTVAPLALVAPPTWTATFVLLVPTVFKSPTPTGTQYTPTTDPELLATGCNNLQLIYDVNVPAGSVLRAGEAFTKTWKVANIGTCNWAYNYRLSFVSGDQMGGTSSNIGKNIVPGKWTEVSVALKAPKTPGTYSGYWRMSSLSGGAFGTTLGVSIVVGTPTDTPVPPTATPVPTDTPKPAYP